MTITLNGTTGITTPTDTATTSVTTPLLTSPASTALTIQSAGTTAMTVDTSQNVGIGTSSPGAYKLNVNGASVNIGATGTGNPSLQAVTTDAAGISYLALQNGTRNYSIRDEGTAGALTFRDDTAAAERMRIDSSGNLLVGTTSSSVSNVDAFSWLKGTGAYSQYQHSSGAASGNFYIGFYYNGSAAIGSITQNGTTAVAYNTSSDYRLKENVTPMTNGLATVSALKPVIYDWVSDKSQGEGFIAHELQSVIPLAVTGEKDAVDDEGNIKPQGVDYSKIVVHLVAAVQELSAQVAALQKGV